MKKVVASFALLFPFTVHAAPSEIRVFTDEIAGYGESMLEVHANKASRAGPEASNPTTPFQLMPEYSYGIRRNWELSLQVPFAIEQGQVLYNGYRFELQYVAPRDEALGFYWGANVETGNVVEEGQSREWVLEVNPIIGFRVDRWHFALNPSLVRTLSGSNQKTNLEPAGKVAYRAFEQNYFGFEYFWVAGPVQHWLPANQQSKVLYLVWDGKIGNSDINVGVGRGFTDGSDEWVFKTIFEIAF